MAKTVRDRLRVEPGSAADLADARASRIPGAGSRAKTERRTAELQARLEGLQERLYAEHRRSLLVVLQGMDTSGKDGTIEHAMAALSPAGTRVTSFKAPTETELRHHFLWRIRRALPGPGEIAIFNRSQYEDVGIVRVKRLAPKKVWAGRFEEINAFERLAARNGTILVKIFLHISSDEQRERLLTRLDDPDKRWKFNAGDLDDRELWGAFRAAYEDALTRCSTDAAPWYVVPADHKWYRNWAVSGLLVETLEELSPRYPAPELDLVELRARLEG